MSSSFKTAVVVTTINAVNPVLRALAAGCGELGWDFVVIGDQSSPADFNLTGSRYFSLAAQCDAGWATASAAPVRHYARKNVGYLEAIRGGAEVIVETDDDNRPDAGFWHPRTRRLTVATATGTGWLNVYRYFHDAVIWPRGLPLDAVQTTPPDYEGLQRLCVECPIQQGLADGDPDVDAVYRLVLPLPITFRGDRRVALGNGAWSPFNSQNTTWWRDAFPLLYLPAYCSFRMTDIWRSLVAQRIAWENGWNILYHESTVWQDRNQHDLMKDFRDEIPGYTNNRRIAEALDRLTLGPGRILDAMTTCYRALVELGVVGEAELDLLQAWSGDLRDAGLMV